jgi:flagellar biosynthesis/type III secretory pathway protein FliH
MIPDKTSITANFKNLSESPNGLLQAKKAHQAGLEILKLEWLKSRRRLAETLRKTKITARRLAYRSAIKKAEKDISELLDAARNQYDKHLAQIHKDSLEVVLKLAEEILQDEVKINTVSLAKRISSSFAKLSNIDNILIRANGKHTGELEEIFKAFPKKVSIKSDNCLDAGNAVIETEKGEICLNWKTQLEIMRQLLLSKIQCRLCT